MQRWFLATRDSGPAPVGGHDHRHGEFRKTRPGLRKKSTNILPSLEAQRTRPFITLSSPCPRLARGFYEQIKDGFWQLVIQGQRQWEAMITVMGSPPWASEEKYATHESCVAHRKEVDEKIEEWAMGHTREEIFHALQREGCAAGPVYSTEEVLQDQQLDYREFFVEMEHPRIGKFKAPSAAYRLSQTPWATRRPAPSIGQHNVEIYGGWLGYEGEGLTQLRQTGVI